jgi:hypothetical protein
MQQAYDALRQEPEPVPDEYRPAQYVSARDDSVYSIKSTFSSIYQKFSEWSLPKKVNLFTLNEDEHDFLLNEPGVSPYSKHDPEENFDDVVDEIIDVVDEKIE